MIPSPEILTPIYFLIFHNDFSSFSITPSPNIQMTTEDNVRCDVCIAVCCSVLQCGAVWCSVVQCGAVWCSVLQCAAVCCSMLQHYNTSEFLLQDDVWYKVWCNVWYTGTSFLLQLSATKKRMRPKIGLFFKRAIKIYGSFAEGSFAKEPYKRDDILQSHPILNLVASWLFWKSVPRAWQE